MPTRTATILSGALLGFDGSFVEVETDIKAGLPGLHIVGMGNKAIDEARERVRSAITNSGLSFPAQKIIVNLAPAELPKDGTHLDLPIALSILLASGQLRPQEVQGCVFAGELALGGTVRAVRGAIVLAELAAQTSTKRLYISASNAPQACLVRSVEVIPVTNLKELYTSLKGVHTIQPAKQPRTGGAQAAPPSFPTFDDIVGQTVVKRALVIAAAGRHNLLLSGSPGAGKTLLAQCLQGLLPPLAPSEILQVTKLHSLARSPSQDVHTKPPLRAPHHSATLTAFIGGGLRPQPGDISLAHKGVLLLDELPEYPRNLLEALRQPLEERAVRLSRLYGTVSYPADTLLVATMNPCPCGFYGDTTRICTCTLSQIARYTGKLSGPLLDRIDMRISVRKVQHEQIFNSVEQNSTTDTLHVSQQHSAVESILIARKAQAERYKRRDFYNSYASLRQAKMLFAVQPQAHEVLMRAAESFALTTRALLRVLRLSRTIADIAQEPQIQPGHVTEALQYRDTTLLQ